MGTSVALSGGGHRASLFGLGVLLYLADHGENRGVSSIASVSGGSITNGYLAKSLDFSTASGDQVRQAMHPMARLIARQGTFQSAAKLRVAPLVAGSLAAAVAAFVRWPGTGDGRALRMLVFVLSGSAISYFCLGRALRTAAGRVYGTLLAPTALTALIAPFLVPGRYGLGWTLLRLAGAVVLLLVWVEMVLRLRGALCLHSFRQTLFPEADGRVALAALRRDGLAQVFCATELQTGDQFYLSPTFVYGYQLGFGEPNGIDLASAVQASAALPGAFPPRRQPTAPLGLSFPSPQMPPTDDRARPFPARLLLVDGGVYDNMGDEWGGGYGARADVWPGLRGLCAEPERLVVVNASGEMRFRTLARPWFPALSELQAIAGDKNVMYDQTTSQRRRGLVARFQLAKLTGHGLVGALVYISQSPYRVPDQVASQAPSEFAVRALARLDALGISRDEWEHLVATSQSVKTTLAALGEDIAALLIWHAYVLAAVNLHVLLEFPIPDELPTRATVRRWVTDGTWLSPAAPPASANS